MRALFVVMTSSSQGASRLFVAGRYAFPNWNDQVSSTWRNFYGYVRLHSRAPDKEHTCIGFHACAVPGTYFRHCSDFP